MPYTNTHSERALGLGGKIRYRLRRGYKSQRSLLLTTLLLAGLSGLLAAVPAPALMA